MPGGGEKEIICRPENHISRGGGSKKGGSVFQTVSSRIHSEVEKEVSRTGGGGGNLKVTGGGRRQNIHEGRSNNAGKTSPFLQDAESHPCLPKKKKTGRSQTEEKKGVFRMGRGILTFKTCANVRRKTSGGRGGINSGERKRKVRFPHRTSRKRNRSSKIGYAGGAIPRDNSGAIYNPKGRGKDSCVRG